MKKFVIDPATFDGAKFAVRYGLDPFKDFHAIQEGGQTVLYAPDSVPDPPIFESPTPSRFAFLRDKRRAGLPLTPIEQQELLDILLGL